MVWEDGGGDPASYPMVLGMGSRQGQCSFVKASTSCSALSITNHLVLPSRHVAEGVVHQVHSFYR